MSLVGQVDFSGVLAGSMPTGLLCMIGDDGNHYATATDGASSIIQVACAEQNDKFAISQAQWQNDFTNVGLGGDPGTSYTIQFTIPVPGTNKFFACGSGVGSGVDVVMGVRYTITSFGVVAIDGGFRYLCGHTMPPGFEFASGNYGSFVSNSHSYAAAIVDNKFYAVLDTGGNLFAFGETFKIHLVELPLTGSVDDQSAGSWDHHITELPWDWTFFRSGTSRVYKARACIIKRPDGIQVLHYRGIAENGSIGACQVLSSIADVGSHTATASSDVSAAWGVPWALDTGYRHDATVGTVRDDYISPYQADNGKIYWSRSFSDDHGYVRTREFTLNTSGDPVAGAVNTFIWTSQTLPSGLNQTIEGIYTFHRQPELLYMAQAQRAYVFGSRTVDSASSIPGQSRIMGF